jgi:hypothetical protein
MQPTQGWPVAYMRFTKSGNPQDNQTWFRQTFFAQQNWHGGFFGRHQVEQCVVPIDVTILGQHKGIRDFLVTHDPNRAKNHSTPNTYLHYDVATQADFSQTNLVGRRFEIRSNNGHFEIEIT